MKRLVGFQLILSLVMATFISIFFGFMAYAIFDDPFLSPEELRKLTFSLFTSVTLTWFFGFIIWRLGK